MADLNEVYLTGRLGTNPEVRYTQNNTPVATVSIAVNDLPPKDNGEESKVNWFNCVFWGHNAEYIGKYAKKGTFILVNGKLDMKNWMEKDKNGEDKRRTAIEVKVKWVNIPHSTESTKGYVPSYPTNSFVPVYDDDSELPF